MKKKIIGIFVVMLLISSAMIAILFSDTVKVEASGGGQQSSQDIGLDFGFVRNMTDNFSKVIYRTNWSGENNIPKGRCWATAGENYTILNILWKHMGKPEFVCGLTDYTNLSIGYLPDCYEPGPGQRPKQYSSKIVIKDYNLTIYNNSQPYQYLPYSEMFPIGIGVNWGGNNLTGFYNLTNVSIREKNLFLKELLGESYFPDYLTVLTQFLNMDTLIAGVPVFLDENDTIPENQNDLVFLMNETENCTNKLDNISTAVACILISNPSFGYRYAEAEEKQFPILRIDMDDTNLTEVLSEMENGSVYFVDNNYDLDMLVFTNLSNDTCVPDEKWVYVIQRLAPSDENATDPIWEPLGVIGPGAYYDFCRLQNRHRLWYFHHHCINPTRGCKGFILSDFSDAHFMTHTVRDWGHFALLKKNRWFPGFTDRWWLPMFSVNKSIGEYLINNSETVNVSSFIQQEYRQQTNTTPGVISHNVVAYRNISKSPDNAIVVLSNRIDGHWGETPGDSGVGGAILLGIAKYFHDNNLTPKYNLTFLFTTGEEYGMRGAQHYVDSHPYGTSENESNYLYFIGFDQLGFNYTNSLTKNQSLEINTNDNDIEKIIQIIENQTNYKARTNKYYDVITTDEPGGGSEDRVWDDLNHNIGTICFGKNGAWDGYHRAGNNFTMGDSLQYIDRNDVNVTFELAWNVTKYFTVNPNCWFENITYQPWDSTDNNEFNDSVNVTLSINTSISQDRICIKATLVSQEYPILCRYTTQQYYIVTPTGIQDTLTITLPPQAPQGDYILQVYLYNSTGIIDRSLITLADYLDYGVYANDTYLTDEFYLYPLNDQPATPHQPWGDTQVLTNETTTYTSHTTDPNNDPIWYQWKYQTRIGSFNFTWHTFWKGPYTSGINCTQNIHWPFSGTYNVWVRAKDFILNPNVISNWSPPLQVTVSKSDNSASWDTDLLSVFTSTSVAENQHTSCTGFAAGVMEGNAQQSSLNWTWDFGDGNVSYGENVSHSYIQKGNYTVNLTLKDDQGETSNFTTIISVDVLSANFNITGEEQPEKTVYFNDTSMGSSSLVNWSWDFGDGNGSYDRNTIHTYTESGEYNVTLTVRDTLNNIHMFTKSVFIESVAPEFISVVDTPDLVGFGHEVTINVDFFDNQSGVESVMVNITYPDNTMGNFTMGQNVSSEHNYVYLFNDTWQTGTYNYSIWVVDQANNTNCTSGFNFTVSAEATINIATLQDNYSGDDYINITDPPTPPENYTVAGRGLTWNTYYNASSGNNILEAYQSPVNYKEDNGTWTPINCSLQSLTTNHPAYTYGYRKGNDRGLFGVYFKPNAQNDWPIAFTYNRSDNPTTQIIRSKLVGVGYLDPASNWAYQYLQYVQSSQGHTTGNSITYNDVFTGTNVTWRYGNTGLKEEITLSNATKTLLQNHPPSQYGLHNASSYLVFITRLDHQSLDLYNASGVLSGNVTISNGRIDFKDALGRFKCALPLGEAYELNNESIRKKLTYRIVHLNGNTYLLSGLKVSDLNAMTFPVIIDPTLTVNTNKSDGYLSVFDSDYNTVWSAKEGAVSDTENFIVIGQNTPTAEPENYSIYRGFLFFNTSSLPFNAIIDNATLTLYKKDDYSTTDFVITIQNGQPDYPKDPLEAGDYDKEHYDGDDESYSSGYGGGLNTTDFVDGMNEIVLTKLDWINKGSITKLCLRSSRDINGTEPTGDEYITIYSADITQETQSYVPQLIITYRNQSKIKNTGSTDLKGYLLIQVQYYDASYQIWIVDNDTVNETSPRTINTGDHLALDTIFNGMIRASDLIHGTGIYRVYAAFRDPDGNILKTSDETELEAWWQFSTT